MKKSKKILVAGLATAMGIVAATAATSGAAWFTTLMKANVQLTPFAAGSSEGTISVAFKSSTTGITGDTNPSEEISLSVPSNYTAQTNPAKKLTDISSSDGENFWKAKIVKANEVTGFWTDEAEDSPVSSRNDKYLNYHEFILNVNNTATNSTGVDVYISKKDASTDLFKDSTSDTDLAGSYRLAIFNEDGDLVFFYSQSGERKYVDPDCGTETKTGNTYETYVYGEKAEKDIVSGLSSSTQAIKPIVLGNEGPEGQSATLCEPGDQCLIENLENSTAGTNLTFRVWVEGCDSTAISDNTPGTVTLNFDIVGVSHED